MTLETSDATRRSFLKTGMLAAVAAAGPASAQAPAARGRTYVLVHGAWFGGWAWKTVAEGLRAAGHTVYAPTMTGVGERKHLARAGINLDTHTDDIVNVIEMEDLSHVVLVGWSYGGMVVGNVLARVTGGKDRRAQAQEKEAVRKNEDASRGASSRHGRLL